MNETLDSRAVAVQGIGYGPASTALQGFTLKKKPPEPEIDDLLWTVGNQARRKRQREEDELLLALLL